MVSETGGSARGWQIGTVISAGIAVAAAIVAYYQNGKIQQLEQLLVQATAALKQQSTVIQAEAKPDLPLSVGFRPALLGSGLVMELRNNSASQLEVAAVLTSGATGMTQQQDLTLPPNQVVQVGAREGWTFAPGQRITFRNVNYRPAAFNVPDR